jgi:putative oxidoreductase
MRPAFAREFILRSLLSRAQPLALVILRVALAAILIAHGKAKIFGGMAAHKHFVASLGMPGWLGYFSAGTEFFGGILLLLGLLTRVAGLAVTVEMLVAITKVHLKNGLTGEHGYEFPMMVCVTAFALIFFGAGPISMDWLLGGGRGPK